MSNIKETGPKILSNFLQVNQQEISRAGLHLQSSFYK
jgi:hypothetical protein